MEQQTTISPALAPASEAPKQQSNVGILDEFQTELIAFWKALPNKGFFFALLGAWIALFHFRGSSLLGYIETSSLFGWMFESYNSPNQAADDKIGNLIPPLVLGIIYWKRKELLATGPRLWWPGAFILIPALALHAVGFMIQEPRVSILGFFLGVYGLTGLAWGWRWMMRSFFPFFLFIFSVPLGNHADIITTRLQLLVCWLVEFVSHNLFGIGVLRRGALLMDPAGQYQYEVAAACSGIRSLFTIFLLATVYGFLNFKSLWQRLFFMALAAPFAVIGNLVRMLFIVLAANFWGQKGGEWVHDDTFFSMVPYVPAILGLIWIGGWMEKLNERRSQKT